jgi:hypothetical protein
MSVRGSREMDNLEEEVFKALDHQIRRNVLRYIGEQKQASFTEILNTVNIPDSPTLSYHLKTLSPFLLQKEGGYTLSTLGKAAYDLLLRTSSYSRVGLFVRNKNITIWSHIVLWISAMAAGLVLEVNPVMITAILPGLAATSLMTIHKLFE